MLQITAPIDCNTEGVTYKLLCRKHRDFFYIGETKRRLRDRIQDHRGYITQKKDHPVGNHFNGPGHGKDPVAYLKVVGFERVLPKGDHLLRKTRESHWINTYNAVTYGANTRD